MAFLNPEADPRATAARPIQSLIAVGTGGLSGRGLIDGVQKLVFLPEPHTDFIYAVIGEELGLIGTTGHPALLLRHRLARPANRARAPRTPSARSSRSGMTTMICAQAFVNMSVVLSLLPTKGIPLPLVSAGGSSLLVSLLGIGMLLNISQHEIVTG